MGTAILTACARPRPRPAPVMKATLRSNLPMMLILIIIECGEKRYFVRLVIADTLVKNVVPQCATDQGVAMTEHPDAMSRSLPRAVAGVRELHRVWTAGPAGRAEGRRRSIDSVR
jgi:hypothetical protein